MKTATIAQVKANFDDYIKASEEGPVIVTQRGKPIAALVTVGKDDLERLAMAHSPKLQLILSKARQRFAEGKGIPHDEFWGVSNEPSGKGRPKRDARRNSPKKRAT